MATKRKTTTRKKTASSTPLQRVNKRISAAKKALREGRKGAGPQLDKAITAKAKLYEKKGRASCKRG